MATVLEIASAESVNAAWEAYRKHAARMFEDNKLILDRGYMEEFAVLENRFKRLSVMPRKY